MYAPQRFVAHLGPHPSNANGGRIKTPRRRTSYLQWKCPQEPPHRLNLLHDGFPLSLRQHQLQPS